MLALVIAIALWSMAHGQSSIERGFSDKDVAKFLKGQKLSFSLSDSLIEDFRGLGAGPRTVAELKAMQAESQGLPAPALSAVKNDGPPQPAPPSAEEQARIIAEARRNALEYTDRFPIDRQPNGCSLCPWFVCAH